MIPLNIIYSDSDLMVLDKPPALVVDPSSTQAEGTLAQILEQEYKITLERGGVVHRLDKDTSGLIVVAKTQAALESLQAQFKDRTVKKEYLTLVHGFLEESIKVEGAIARHPIDREKFVVVGESSRDFKHIEGKEAATTFIPKEFRLMNEEVRKEIFPDFNKIQMRKLDNMEYGRFTLVSCQPETGRTHQIRVHLKYINHPLVSDERYGGRKVVRLDKRWCPRQFLHASRLEINHPTTGERLSFESPLPEDLEKALWKTYSYNLPLY